MKNENQSALSLPENAYRPLKSDEIYQPVISAHQRVPEVTFRSVFVGLIMAVVFSGACAFLGLKVGQVFEAAIPIAILAVGLSSVFRKKSTILENVIIQSIGATSGVVVAGAIFTLPAIFILHLNVHFFEIVTASFFGGCLGILFLILFRRYFVSDMHGQLPFPEATATTEVLVTGEQGGAQAKILAISMIIGALYDFSVYALHWVNENFTTTMLGWGKVIEQKTKLVFEMNVTASIIGLGYIIGLRYSAIICAGSVLAWYVFIPLSVYFSPSTAPIVHMAPLAIFKQYISLIGIGSIACAGVIGILKSFKIIKDSIALGVKEIFAKRHDGRVENRIRTHRDIKMKYVFLLVIVIVTGLFLFFRFGVVRNFLQPWELALIAVAIVTCISFLFTSVAARAIAIIGSNPVSGMTLMTLIVTSLILNKAGLSGDHGIMAALIIGGVVATALAMAGSFITDLKIGYWLGSTPANQERFKFLGTLFSAVTVGLVILLLNQTYGFILDAAHPDALIAPQANAMAAVITTLMSNSPVPWVLYGVGCFIAIICEMCGIPPLAFALGMYLPLELTTPLLFGALISYFVKNSSKNEVVSQARSDCGTLIASGLIAGGAIVGVIAALLKYFNVDKTASFSFFINLGGSDYFKNIASLVVCFALAIFVYFFAKAVAKHKMRLESE